MGNLGANCAAKYTHGLTTIQVTESNPFEFSPDHNNATDTTNEVKYTPSLSIPVFQVTPGKVISKCTN